MESNRGRRLGLGVLANRLTGAGERPQCPRMAIETVHIVQAYVQGRGKGLKAEQQVGCKTAEDAQRKAERLAPLRLGVVAFSASADTEMGDYDENPTILFKAGQLPPPWNEDYDDRPYRPRHAHPAGSLASNADRAAVTSPILPSDQAISGVSAPTKVRPNGVRAYSTVTGVVAKTWRDTSPSRSRAFSVWASIFCDTPPMRRFRLLNRIGP